MTTDLKVIGADSETYLIGPENLAPELVCVTAATSENGQLPFEQMDSIIAVRHSEYREDGDWLKPSFAIEDLLSGKYRVVFQNAPFDLAVFCRYNPSYISRVFEMLADGLITDTATREKLLNLADHGSLEWVELPDGSNYAMKYRLYQLVWLYFGVDLQADKEMEDAWRLNYHKLVDVRAEDWPEDASEYATHDAAWADLLFWAQEKRRQKLIEERGIDPFTVEAFRCSVDFTLHLASMHGMATDADEVRKLTAKMEEQLTPDNLRHLIESGILVPAQPPAPYKNGAKNKDGSPKMTKAKPEKTSKKALQEHIEELAKLQPDMKVKKTKTGISTTADWIEENEHRSPILAEWHFRQKLQKIVTTEIPRMMWEGEPAPVVHPCYDVLKTTGRTSSFSRDTYPSFNGQNVDPRARGCYVARPDRWLVSIDYNAMELGTTAQKCLDLFGTSQLAKIINAGEDPHGYLGAQLAFMLDETFKDYTMSEVGVDEGACAEEEQRWKLYEAFKAFKTSDVDDVVAFYKHWRKFAKPTGLGYPGGLGPKTFMQYAKATYGVVVPDLDTATRMREIWRMAFPEMVLYHKWINEKCIDPWNAAKTVTVDPTPEELEQNPDMQPYEKVVKQYAYDTPMGMHVAGRDYTSAANGACMQAFSAEGALLGWYNVSRGCYDPSLGSPLLGTVWPILFIHDEIVAEVPACAETAAPLIDEMSRIMVEAMQTVTPDVRAGTEACLMTRWSKFAEPNYNENGLLIPWEPKEQAA